MTLKHPVRYIGKAGYEFFTIAFHVIGPEKH